jgi:probable aminopeptidase NPEPL1
LYAFNALVSTNFDSNAELHAILCLAENAIGPNSFRNGDILKVLSKKTVEINNTDAEGRLVLADGVYYASKNLQATTIIDMATLTGAQGIATGQRHAAIYCNDDEFENAAVHAGRVSGDLVHPLPYAPEFFREEFSSPIADMRNSVKNRMNASSACAGQFVGNHIDSDFKGRWLHIDMAYPATRSERSTGYGVALLTSLIHKSLRKIKLLV